ncbi:MAG: class I SAM-dependent methyltransferase [Betaproteobacteria bacterium]|nr:MAG: class I SAM-dependent methyltransferase [Betaproteobacteria bacterium]
MLGSMLGDLYRRLTRKLFGVEALVQESVARELDARVPELMRSEIAALLQSDGGPRLMLDVEKVANILASVSSAQYFLQHMLLAENLIDREALIRFAMKQCSVEGLVMEFGVYAGRSLRVIAECTPELVYGFDSFEGLPEDWTRHQKQGRFDLEGKLPKFVEPNVRLVRGWFNETLPPFLSQYAGPVRFLHVDCDLYSSAATVFTHVGARIVPGTVILFDEYFNYPGWEQHEFRAFQEFVARSGLKYSYIGFASSYPSVAVKIT